MYYWKLSIYYEVSKYLHVGMNYLYLLQFIFCIKLDSGGINMLSV